MPELPALGTWVLRRRVADLLTGQRGRVRGTVQVTADDDEQRWRESGVLRWGGRDIPVTREHLLRPGDGGVWWVHFADGRPFHPWLPGEDVEHHCGDDAYRGRTVLGHVLGQEWVTVRWRVTGPSKDQLLRTTLTLPRTATPLPAGASASR